MASRDIETVLKNIRTFLQANLSAKLAAIDAEKNDGLTLGTVDSEAYSIQVFARGQNYNPVILIVAESNGARGIGPATAQTFRVKVLLILEDRNNDSRLADRLFRYNRAFVEIFDSNWEKINGRDRFEIQSVTPRPWTEWNGPEDHYLTGVELTLALW